jgi:mRNA interferase HicA
MKRKDLLRHLRNSGCCLLREGSSHSVWINPHNGQQSTLPRQREINDYTAKAITKQLGIEPPPNK